MAYPKRLFMGLGLSIANGWPNNQGVLPQITTQPISQTIDEYSTATFTVAATGTAPLTYTWRKNGAIVGTNSASYSLTTVSTDSGAVITCTVSNLAGSVVSSNAVLTIQRNFVTFDPVLQTHMTMQTAKTFAGGFEITADVVFHTTQTAQQTIVSGVSASNNSIIIDKSLNQVRAFAFIGNAITSIPTVTIPNDGKLHKVKLRYAGTVAYLSVDDGTESSAIWGLNGSQSINLIGMRGAGTNYFDGAIANVTLTDLTTPSNSESWRLDRPIGTNTEQSSSGNNLLTYVNATKREKFTKVGNDWLGVELIAQPINIAGGWVPVGGATNLGVNTWDILSEGGVRTGDIGAQGKKVRLSYSVTATASAIQIKDSSTGQSADPTVATIESSSTGLGVVNYTATLQGLYLRSGSATNGSTINSISLKRLLEVA